MNKDKIGQKGEQIAVDFLVNKDYIILSKNWRFQHKEIDIIAKKYGFLVVVEVKTRSSDYIMPREAVNRKKQENLIKAVAAYIEKYQIELEIRFDIIEVIITKDTFRVHHIKDAFYPIL